MLKIELESEKHMSEVVEAQSAPEAQNAAPVTEQQQTDNPEAVKAEAAPKPEAAKPVDEKLASKFAALSRKEKQIREQRRELDARDQRLKALETELNKMKAERESQDSELKSKLKSGGLKALRDEVGLTYEQLTEQALNDENPTPQQMMQRLREELKSEYSEQISALRKELEDEKARKQQDAEESAKNAYKSELKDFISKNEKYELTQTNEAYDLAYDVAEQYYAQTGKVLSYEEAANYVEEHLEEQANKILELKKIKAKLGAAQPKVEAKTATTATLSNSMSAELPVNGSRTLSKEESLREAAKLIRWD